MTGRIVHHDVRPHVCAPGWEVVDGHYRPLRCSIGDIWACDCGELWRAIDAPSNYAVSGQRSVGAVEWRKLSNRQRRKHQRTGEART